ncbi:hypothetical protein ADK52_25450 [Streptomyces sp. WM6372]|uniref:hypothetical protein n=1 Tax=Streptomyces sp. WM6372 TaxID=1415555 RepID=UPI0006AEB5A3|nr:hypothetical protein [Streptomyces sp. WM6372]KOU20938.1 hypothetical protein ADK52_25450 [Streptomyces sp. WM6372]
MLTLLLVAGGLALGYLTGRVQPASRAMAWAWRQTLIRQPARYSRRWWAVQAVFGCAAAGLLATRPQQTMRNWRARHTMPPRSPAPRLRDTPLGEP